MASLSKRIRKRIKKYSRKALAIGSKVSRVARPLVSAAAGYFAGPAGSAAVTALSHYAHQYQAASGARLDGYRGREARAIGRAVAQRTTTHSIIAGGVGSLASGVTSALAGGNFFGGAAAGQGGASLLGGNTIFGSAASGSLLAAGEGTAATLAGLQFGWDSLAQSDAPTEAQPVQGASTWNDLLEAVAAGAAAGLSGGDAEAPQQEPDRQRGPFDVSNVNSPTDEEGEQPAWVMPALLGLGALVLLS